MLQIPAHDASNLDVLRLARDARNQAANAAHDHVDLYAGAGSVPQLLNDAAVRQGIQLEEQVSFGPLLHLPFDSHNNLVLQLQRRHQQVVVSAFQVSDAHVPEKQCRVLPDSRVCRHQGEIRVQLGGGFVVVSGADLGVPTKGSPLISGNQAQLGVHLEVGHSVHDGAAGFFKLPGPIDVVLFIETGAELNQHRDLLAVFRRPAQVLHQLAFARQAINGNLDGTDIRIRCRLFQQAQERLHAFVRIGQQAVLLANLIEHGFFSCQFSRSFRRVRFKEHLLLLLRIQLVLQAVSVLHLQRAAGVENLAVAEEQAALQELQHFGTRMIGHLQAKWGQAATILQQLLHKLSEVLVFLAVLIFRVNIRISGDANLNLFFHRVGVKDHIRQFQKQVFHADVANARTRQVQNLRQVYRHRQEGKVFLAFLFPQAYADFNALVAEVRERMLRIYQHRGQHRQDGIAEIVFHVFLLGGGHLIVL